MKRFACGDIMPGCDIEFVASSDEEILSAVARHAREVHGLAVLPESVVAQVRAGTEDV